MHLHLGDVADRAEMDAWIRSTNGLDLVLACAGITGGTRKPQTLDGMPYEPAAQIYRIFETDMMGVLNTVLPALDVMQHQPRGADGMRGRICAISSVAGWCLTPARPLIPQPRRRWTDLWWPPGEMPKRPVFY